MIDVQSIRSDFPILKRTIGSHRLAFLDSGASSQMPNSVIDRISNHHRIHHANVHRSVYAMAEESTARYEAARKKIARFIGAEDETQVIFGKNVTEQLNLIAKTLAVGKLKQGDTIVLTLMEHHANFVPWLQIAEQLNLNIRIIALNEDGTLDLSSIDKMLDGAKVFAFTAISNVLGTINPVAQLTKKAAEHGAISVVDAAQWVPHMPTDIRSFDADFVAFTGHKMYGPTGVGVLWGRKALLEELPPFLGGGDMILDVRIDGFDPAELPYKFEAGTPPIAQVIGLGAAVDYLNTIGMDNIRAHEEQLVDYMIKRLNQQFGDDISIYGPEQSDIKAGIVSFDFGGIHAHDVGQHLGELGVCVRASHHCAKPLHKHLNVPATVRASLAPYNDTDDVDQLVEALIDCRETYL